MKQRILNHFRQNDEILYRWAIKFKNLPALQKDVPSNYLVRLTYEIVGQQLSGKVADAIFARFKKLFRGAITARKILLLPHQKLRKTGMSNAKARYLKYLAKAIANGTLRLSKLDSLPDEEVKRQLLEVKGIGPWTTEMFLMFTLGREDVFSPGDLGLQKGVRKIYKLAVMPNRKKLEMLIKRWSPYRTWAARILWRSVDEKSPAL